MSVWRGRSGRRYVVVVQPLDASDLVAEEAAVMSAAARNEHGQASIVAARACKAGYSGFLSWLVACVRLDAHEFHAYRLAETRSHRAEIATDLGEPTAGIAMSMA
ncbi:hypothetical protein [Methylobacterium mesophilicum]